ncbi:MAG: hypothetical protein IT381_19545 [Deltaproteobacteria bacterium]|nr:hypothetical protein [Deltaproteobacteria bacterium]
MRALLAGIACLWFAGCSLIIDTGINGLKCANKQCRPDYSCRAEDCVANNSLKEGETCTDNIQCSTGLICPHALFVCARPCNKVYDVNNDCGGTNTVCAPVYDLANKGKFKGGACVKAECSGDDANKACQDLGGRLASPNSNNRCVRLAQNGGMCLPICQIGIRVADSSRGVDQCVADSQGNPTHCGRVANGDLICLPAGAAPDGSKCVLYPLSVGGGDDACSLNIGPGNVAGFPLICLNSKGTANPVDGELRCRKGACNPMNPADCGTAQVCDTKLMSTFCKGPTE